MPRDERNESRNSRDREGPAHRQASMQAMASKRESENKAASGSSSSRPKPPTKIAGGRFEIDKKLGAGCFGEVYRGVNVETKEQIAVKFEALEAHTQQLEQEAAILNLLKQGLSEKVQPQGFPECFWFGREGRYQCLVMECLGKSLEDRVQMQNGKFKPFTTALIAEQLVRRVEYLHSKGIVHRDIKPENFMWGTRSKLHHVFMIDFGLSKRYFDKVHIQPREKLSLTGTARYASINAHRGLEQSRRDDLEAIGHMLLYFLRGALPWSGLDARTKEEKYRKIRQKKEDTALDDLCNGFPPQFKAYLHYSRNLSFMERPDYKWMRQNFQEARQPSGEPGEEYALEWIVDNPDVNVKDLVSVNPWTPPKQPDDVETESKGGLSRLLCHLCGAKQVRKMDK